MPKKDRPIEIYVGYSNGSDAGHWGTEYVRIPLDTPEEKIAAVACKAMQTMLDDRGVENAAFFGVYNIPDPEDEEDDS